jgi:hypothetical protein
MIAVPIFTLLIVAVSINAQPPNPITLPLTFPSDYYHSSRDTCAFMNRNSNTYKSLFSGCNFTSKYRTFDGSCNNIDRPWTGMAGTPFKRYMPSNYADGVSSLRGSSVRGASLPNERVLSVNYCVENANEDNRWTNFMPIFGQFVTHDITALSPTLGISPK